MDIRSPGDADQAWHSMGPAEQNFYLEGLNHINLARPELQRMYATGASLQFKLVMTWDITTSLGEQSEYHMRLVSFPLHAPTPLTAGRPREPPWDAIMSRIQSDVRNRMEYVRGATSDIVFHRIERMIIHVAPHGGTPARGSAGAMPVGGGTYKELPVTLSKKKACVNMQNKDYRCFQYCIMNWLSDWYEGRDSQRWPRLYMCYPDGDPIQKRLRQGVPLVPVDVGLDFSMVHSDRSFPLEDIPIFEKANGKKVGVYVYTWCTLELPQEDDTTETFETWRQIRAPDETVTWGTELKLMLIDEHYSLITHFDRLASFRGKGYKKCKIIGMNKNGHGLLCHRCGSTHKFPSDFQKHLKDKECCRIAKDEDGHPTFRRDSTLPEPYDKWGNKTAFKWKVSADMCMHPCVVTADLEAFSNPVNRDCGQKSRVVIEQDKIASLGYHVY